VLVGIVITLVTLAVALPGNADSGAITVSGTVPGPPPSTAPVITVPANNTQVTSQQITVGGSCNPGLTVVVTDNQVGNGSAFCSQNGSFSLMISLAAGVNVITAYHLDSLNQSGPSSSPVTVTYQPSTASSPTAATSPLGTVTPTTSTTHASSPAAGQFTITAPYRFDGVISGATFTLHSDIEGGTPPYAVQIDWGDRSQVLLSRAVIGPFTAQHTYATAGHFTIKLAASDANGLSTYYQTTITVGGAGAAAPPTSATPNPVAPVVPAYELAIIWPLFLVICLIAFSFWLGELYDRRYWRSPPPSP
jgi:hypothetical protein